MPTAETNIRIGQGSWISVALLITCVTGVAGGAFWLASFKTNMETGLAAGALTLGKMADDLQDIKSTSASLQSALHDVQRDLQDRWRFRDEMWVWSEVQRLNPTFNVPRIGRTSDDRSTLDDNK